MSLIITNPTDQHKVRYGYCTKCWEYNEVWRNEKVSNCSWCGTIMYHVSSWKIWLIGLGLCLMIIDWL